MEHFLLVLVGSFGSICTVGRLVVARPPSFTNVDWLSHTDQRHIINDRLILLLGVIDCSTHACIRHRLKAQRLLVRLYPPKRWIIKRVVKGVGVHRNEVNGLHELREFGRMVDRIATPPGFVVVRTRNPHIFAQFALGLRVL